MQLVKGLNPLDVLKSRTEIYVAVIDSASRNSLDKMEVPKIADSIWDSIIAPLTEAEKPNANKPASQGK